MEGYRRSRVTFCVGVEPRRKYSRQGWSMLLSLHIFQTRLADSKGGSLVNFWARVFFFSFFFSTLFWQLKTSAAFVRLPLMNVVEAYPFDKTFRHDPRVAARDSDRPRLHIQSLPPLGAAASSWSWDHHFCNLRARAQPFVRRRPRLSKAEVAYRYRVPS